MKTLIYIVLSLSLLASAGSAQTKGQRSVAPPHKYYYCEYCGHKFPTVQLLTSGTCPRHPNGPNKGNHKLYEGTEKKEYTCKYCGHHFSSIMQMVGATCPKSPKGSNRGMHVPAL